MVEYKVNISVLLCSETTLHSQHLAVRRILSLVASVNAGTWTAFYVGERWLALCQQALDLFMFVYLP